MITERNAPIIKRRRTGLAHHSEADREDGADREDEGAESKPVQHEHHGQGEDRDRREEGVDCSKKKRAKSRFFCEGFPYVVCPEPVLVK